ncbi:MAG: hypothetical protein GXO75_19175 [Calditrichaeota bacterium]|nr:hypothetical protein [Calditrichota bacterium]
MDKKAGNTILGKTIKKGISNITPMEKGHQYKLMPSSLSNIRACHCKQSGAIS